MSLAGTQTLVYRSDNLQCSALHHPDAHCDVLESRTCIWHHNTQEENTKMTLAGIRTLACRGQQAATLYVAPPGRPLWCAGKSHLYLPLQFRWCRNETFPGRSPLPGLEPPLPGGHSAWLSPLRQQDAWCEMDRICTCTLQFTSHRNKTAPQRSPSPGLEPRPSWQPTTLASGSYTLHYNSRQDLRLFAVPPPS